MTAPTPGLAAFGVMTCDACGMQFRPSRATLNEYKRALETDPDLTLYCFVCEEHLTTIATARGSDA